ncbi:exodeoxyribonuclease VII large subunit, partial [Achromobacter ruhlandii]
MTIELAVTNNVFARDILTVAQLNQAVGQLLERSIPALWVRGEISNFTQAASGHWYFTLKDSRAAVRAVMFRGRASAVGFVPRAGDQVEIRARVSLYEPRGDYQLQVDAMRRAGLGNLYEAFLRLKEQLDAEGLFDPARKREPAPLPRAIGVITSLHAAALRDVLSALARRAPQVPVIIYPAPVQGADAAGRLAAQIRLANARGEVDTLLLVRGGGSIEDLWSFNDEALARAIDASAITTISGVGHETDFTIADFVADVRAPTPTAAAELACVPRSELLGRVMYAAETLVRGQQRRLERAAQRLDRATAQLVSPAQRLEHQRERLNGLSYRLASAWAGPQARR